MDYWIDYKYHLFAQAAGQGMVTPDTTVFDKAIYSSTHRRGKGYKSTFIY